jgi:hypothetical protein
VRGVNGALSSAVTRALARRPDLWVTAVAQAGRLARPRWWRHRPFLPLPDPDYVRFRLETQYGRDAPADGVAADDVVTYLAWCRDVRRLSRARDGHR